MKHTCKLIYRNFRKNLSINLINVGGLTISMTVVLILAAHCYSELTTDLHHDKVDQTYLVTNSHELNDMDIVTPGVLADHLISNIPEAQKVVRLAGTWSPPVVKHKDAERFETNLMFADDGFFQVFSFSSIMGNLEIALKEPMSAVLVSSEAMRLFGTKDVVGKTLTINNQYQLNITAVVEENPNNSILTFKIVTPVSSIPQMPIIDNDLTSWDNWFFMTFIQLAKGADIQKVDGIIDKIFYDNAETDESPEISGLLPLSKVYFSGIDNAWLDFLKVGDKSKVIILMMVAILIFLMAIINYLNISTYGLRDRLHQSGIFKIIGANRYQLLKNTIVESILIFIFTVWIAFILTELLKPLIYYYTGLTYSNHLLFSPTFVSASFIGAILLAFASSISNAIKISSTHPIDSLRKSFNTKSSIGFHHGSLVVLQFCATITLISFTFLVDKQIEFGGKDLGFAKENIFTIKRTDQLKKEVLMEKLSNQSNVKNISLTTFYPSKPFSQWGATLIKNGKEKYAQFTVVDADANFMDMIGLELTSGRNFSNEMISESNKVLVNESFVKKNNLETPIGSSINNRFEIIGVIKDFHFKSKNHAIGPLAILNRGAHSHYLVELHTADFNSLSKSVESIKEICKELSPDYPVEISFLDLAVENMYQSEIQFRRTFTFFAACAIFISCLGVLALSLFTIQRRTKEIGIRKVNGAHAEDILMLLNKGFVKWVGIAFVIAAPISWFSMNKWMEHFAYKTNISWWIFLVGGGAALTIALLTVSWQSWMAARRNPVDALRHE